VTVFGVLLFLVILFDLLFPLGFFFETSSFFIIASYARLVSYNIFFFSNKLENAIYLFPKYKFSDHFFSDTLTGDFNFAILFSELYFKYPKFFKNYNFHNHF
jgi:hypothetical protein